MALERVVLLRGMDNGPDGIRDDMKAGEAGILPGHMLDVNATGDLIKHATAGGKRVGKYALEREEAGDDLDVAYALGDAVKYIDHISGVTLNLILATGQTVAANKPIVSNGNGQVKLWTAETADESIIGYSDEAVTTTAATKRLAVRLS